MRTGIRWINRFCTIYILCWSFVPSLQIGNLLRVIAGLCAIAWLLTVAILDQSFFRRNYKYLLLCITTIVAVIVLRAIMMPLGDAVIRSLQWMIVAIIGMMFLYYKDSDYQYLQPLITIILFLVAVFSVTTIIGDMENPYASRIANSEWLRSRFEGNENIGTYGFVYMCVFIEPCLLYLAKNKIYIGKIAGFLVRFNLVTIFVMVFVAGYTIAVLCTLLLVFGILLYKDGAVFRNVISCIILVIVIVFYKQILLWITEVVLKLFSENYVWAEKMAEIRLMLTSAQQSGDLSARIKNYLGSVRNIIKNPVFGCYLFGRNPSGGGHSFILDSIGQFGVLPAVLMFSLLIKYPHQMAGVSKRNVLSIWVGVVWTLFLFVDPYTQEMAIALFFVYPFTQLVYSSERSLN